MEYNVEVNLKLIGQRLRKGREELGLSREGLAELVDLSDYYVGQLERGERQMSLPVLINVSNTLHINLDYLVFGKLTSYESYANDAHNIYNTATDSNHEEINSLLNKCSAKELDLIKKMIKTILPYLN